MAINPYFNNYTYAPTQNLIEDIVLESIKQYGIDVYYIPKKFNKLDNIFGEDILQEYKNVFKIEMYLENFAAMGGEREIISKFGLEIKDEFSLIVSKKRFEYESSKLPVMNSRPVQIESPMMGDLIYFPFTKGLFEIKYVDNKHIFYQQGKIYTYKVDCELYKYSYEKFNTGIDDVDDIEKNLVNGIDVNSDGTPDYSQRKIGLDDSSFIQDKSSSIIDFSEKDPFSQGNY